MRQLLFARAALLISLALPACTEPNTPPTLQGSVLPDSAEQMAFGVNFYMTDQGIRRAAVLADTMLLYDQGTRTELKQVNTTFFTATGEQNAILTAREGTYSIRLGTMEARRKVIVTTTDGRKLETEQLRYDPSRNEVSSDSAFVLTELERVTEGVGFVADPELTNIRILRVIKVSGQPVSIPKR